MNRFGNTNNRSQQNSLASMFRSPQEMSDYLKRRRPAWNTDEPDSENDRPQTPFHIGETPQYQPTNEPPRFNSFRALDEYLKQQDFDESDIGVDPTRRTFTAQNQNPVPNDTQAAVPATPQSFDSFRALSEHLKKQAWDDENRLKSAASDDEGDILPPGSQLLSSYEAPRPSVDLRRQRPGLDGMPTPLEDTIEKNQPYGIGNNYSQASAEKDDPVSSTANPATEPGLSENQQTEAANSAEASQNNPEFEELGVKNQDEYKERKDIVAKFADEYHVSQSIRIPTWQIHVNKLLLKNDPTEIEKAGIMWSLGAPNFKDAEKTIDKLGYDTCKNLYTLSVQFDTSIPILAVRDIQNYTTENGKWLPLIAGHVAQFDPQTKDILIKTFDGLNPMSLNNFVQEVLPYALPVYRLSKTLRRIKNDILPEKKKH